RGRTVIDVRDVYQWYRDFREKRNGSAVRTGQRFVDMPFTGTAPPLAGRRHEICCVDYRYAVAKQLTDDGKVSRVIKELDESIIVLDQRFDTPQERIIRAFAIGVGQPSLLGALT